MPVEAETTAIGSSLLRLNEGERQRYKLFFRTVYAVAKRCKPFGITNIYASYNFLTVLIWVKVTCMKRLPPTVSSMLLMR